MVSVVNVFPGRHGSTLLRSMALLLWLVNAVYKEVSFITNSSPCPRGDIPICYRALKNIGWLVGCLGVNGPLSQYFSLYRTGGWSGGAMVLGKLPVPGRPTIWITVGQGPTALAVGAGGGCLDIFTLIYPFSPLSPSLWDTARYRLKYCLKGPLNPKQPTISDRLLERGRQKREMIDVRKMCPNKPHPHLLQVQ